MSTPSNFDIGPLTWVKAEIDAALAKAREQLTLFAGNTADSTPLKFAQTHLHQVTGAVQMVGLDGLARFAEEVERLLAALEKRELEADGDRLDLADQGFTALARYLDDLMAGAPDVPLRLFPIYRALLQARGAERISEADLFYPDLSVRAPRAAADSPVSEADFPRYVRAERSQYQKGLLKWLRQPHEREGLEQMKRALQAIEATQTQPANRTFWWNAVAFVDGLLEGGLEPEFAVKSLCARIDQQIRRLGERSSKVAERLLRDVLYHIARAKPATERLASVKQAYALDEYLAAAPLVTTSGDEQAERLRPLLRELGELVAGAKEAWLKFTAGNPDALKAFHGHAARLADKARALEHPALDELLHGIAQGAARLMAGAPRNETVDMEMATALLLAENAIENFAHLSPAFVGQAHVQGKRLAAALAGESLAEIEVVPLLDEMARRAQEKLLLAQVGTEIQTNLRQVEQVLDAFFRDHTKRAELPKLARYMTQIEGALRILELERAAELLAACQRIIDHFADPAYEPQPGELERLAEGLSALGFYVEAVQHGRPDAFEILAPVIKRFPELKQREAEAREEETVLPPLASVEEGLEDQKKLAQTLYAAWKADPTDANREALLAQVALLQQDADLMDDARLKERASRVLDLLSAGTGATEALDTALAELAAPRVATVAPSAETAALLEASKEAIDREMLEVYLEEAQDVLATVAEHLSRVRIQPHDHGALTTIRRGFHTLKGSGRMVGLTDLGEVAWGIEQTMNKWLQEERDATPELIDMLQQAHAAFTGWVDTLNREGHVTVHADELLAKAAALRGEPPPGPPSPPTPPPGPGAATVAEAQAAPDTLTGPQTVAEIQAETVGAADEMTMPGDTAPGARRDPGEAMSSETVFPEPESGEQAISDSERERPQAGATGAQPLATEGPSAPWEDRLTADPHQLLESLATEAPAAPLEAIVETLPAPPPPPSEIDVGGRVLSPTLYELFLNEAGQHLARLREGLAALRQAPAAPIPYDFMRAAHTLGGICSTVGFGAPADCAYALERFLVDLLDHPRALPPEDVALIGGAIEALSAMVEAIRRRETPTPAADTVAALAQRLEAVRAARADSEASSSEPAAAPLGAQAETGSSEEPVQGRDDFSQAVSTPAQEARAAEAGAPDGSAAATSISPAAAAPEPASGIRDDLDADLLPIFLEEAEELIPIIGQQLRAWQAAPSDRSAQQALQRALHTLKGSARMAGAMRLGELTHQMETRVIAAMEGGAPEPALFEQLTAHFDRIGDLHDALQRGETAPAVPTATSAAAAASGPVPVVLGLRAQTGAPLPSAVAEPEAGRAMLRVRADVVDRLVNEAGEVSIARSRIEGEIRNFKQLLKELTDNVIRLRAQLREVEIQAETQMQSRLSMAQDAHQEFDPLEFDRFTRLQELTRMMAESVNDVSTVQQALLKNIDEAEAALLAQARMNRELQQQLMHIRMVPLSSITERLQRIVRQTAKELGKEAVLTIQGEGVELDRSVLEKMTAPFEHLLRNALAHGLESQAERQSAGKPPAGQLNLIARQEGNEVVLTIADDGAGIDLERVRAKAVEMGWLAPGEEASPARLMEMIFQPGFSTASEITQIAGRGVGMDVVRNEIASLGGRIEVASEKGKGTTFTIYLPLTLAVTQAVLVHAGGQIYAIPSSMVEQVQELRPEPLAEVYRKGQVEWLGNVYPLYYLPRLLGDDTTQPEALLYTSIMLLRSGSQRCALHVDALEGNQEIVIKNIGPQLARVTGISGATVLGNGRIVLIINPVQLAHRETPHVAAQVSMPAGEALSTTPVIMVVDDSLTVRKITGRLLAKEGYQVITAKDGVDALQQLQETLPAVMLVDIEMPRMDGFELTKNVRGDPRTRHIPIIMITSRTAEKHRNYAKELGVNVYLGKPYQEEELLAHIERFVREGAVLAA
ncbi:Hpt domain-containing protein [Thiobacter aerophilum]|uniref:histidine kinase n=1 Tax=Thiobacter aerophilum TaxID=3121275 RepID=A0ABV0ECQ4_9BURK